MKLQYKLALIPTVKIINHILNPSMLKFHDDANTGIIVGVDSIQSSVSKGTPVLESKTAKQNNDNHAIVNDATSDTLRYINFLPDIYKYARISIVAIVVELNRIIGFANIVDTTKKNCSK